MKRPHRRIHFLAWLLLAPLTLILGLIAWSQRPETPYSDIPAAIQPIENSGD